jgi:4-amino-4-deoxy-L-arabinose transferase-like glycosyltransferase
LAAILLGAALVRGIYSFVQTGIGPKDPEQYELYAWNLARGEGYQAHGELARRPPGLPFVVATVYRFTGRSPRAARFVVVGFGVALCGAIYCLGRRVGTERTGLLAAAIAAGHPYLVYYSGSVMSETLAAFWFCLLTAWWVRWTASTPLSSFALGGVLAGLASLTRSVFLGLPALMVTWSLQALPDRRRAWGASLAFLAGMSAVVLPWALRNYAVLGIFVPVQTGGGWQAYEYTLWYADPAFPTFEPERLTERAREFRRAHRELYSRFRALPEAERDAVAVRELLGWIRTHPGDYVKATLRKFYWFWRPSDFAVVSGQRFALPGWFSWAAYLPLLGLATVGWPKLPAAARLLFGLSILYLVLVHSLLFHGTPRFRFPIYPHWIVAAAVGLERVASLFGRR